jgi:hypothetical protein
VTKKWLFDDSSACTSIQWTFSLATNTVLGGDKLKGKYALFAKSGGYAYCLAINNRRLCNSLLLENKEVRDIDTTWV